MPSPTPGLHLAVSRARLGQMNDNGRNAALVGALRKVLGGGDGGPGASRSLLCLGGSSLLPLLAARLGAGRVFCAERNPQMRAAMEGLAAENGLADDRVVFTDAEAAVVAVDAVVGEPHFSLSMLPWHNLRFWFELDSVRRRRREEKGEKGELRFFPLAGELWGMPVEFRDLWKIRAPVGSVEGFGMAPFDQIIMVKPQHCT